MQLNKKFWKGKKILITGHTGFKGGWLSVILSLLGSEVSGFALNPQGKYHRTIQHHPHGNSKQCACVMQENQKGDRLRLYSSGSGKGRFNHFHQGSYRCTPCILTYVQSDGRVPATIIIIVRFGKIFNTFLFFYIYKSFFTSLTNSKIYWTFGIITAVFNRILHFIWITRCNYIHIWN